MSSMPAINCSSSDVVDFYNQRSVLITGSSGFLGKVLVEKLLRSVPGIKHLFLLIRPQNELDANQRLEGILRCPLFDRIRKQSPEILTKLVPINGNITEENLGLSEQDTQRLLDEVSVVFHCAATIKFDEALRVSVSMNVVGTQKLLHLCRRMKNITVFVHASTAYANCDRAHILETVYTPPIKPQQLVDALAWMDDNMVTSLTPLLVGRRPNTYTYTKALAEFVVAEESVHVPIIVVRPSIIGAVWREPLPGWIDNLNGPTGLFAAVGKGLLRSMYGDVDAKADIVPVDVVSNLLIVSAWHRASIKSDCCPVINCCSGRLNTLKWKKVLDSFKTFETYPFENIYRVPYPRFTMNRVWRDLNLWIDHMFPAYLVDTCCRLLGKKARMVRVYKKIFKAVDTLEYFTTREWDFQTKGIVGIWEDLSAEDKTIFNFNLPQLSWDQYLEMYILGVKKFILKEELSNLPTARKQFHRLQIWTAAFNVAMSVVVFRVLIRRSKIFRQFWFYILSLAAALWRVIHKSSKPSENNSVTSSNEKKTPEREVSSTPSVETIPKVADEP